MIKKNNQINENYFKQYNKIRNEENNIPFSKIDL